MNTSAKRVLLAALLVVMLAGAFLAAYSITMKQTGGITEPAASVPAVTAAQVKGKWEILGWTVDADGSWSALTGPKQYYTFDGTKMDYDMGDGQVLSSAYTVGDGGVELTDWAMTWPGYMNDKNQLCLKDGRYDITYVCDYVEAVADGSLSGGQQGGESQSGGQSSSGSQSSGTDWASTLVGSWKLYAWSLGDGSSYTEVANDEFVFSADRVVYTSNGAFQNESIWAVSNNDTGELACERVDGSGQFVWVAKWGDNGVLLIDQPMGSYSIVYYCTRK